MKNDVKRLIRELRPYYGWLCLAMVFAVISVVLTLAAPVLSGRAVDCLAGKGKVNYRGLFANLRLMIFALCGTAVSTYCMNRINNRIAYRFNRRLRNAAFDHLVHMKIKAIDSHPAGDFTSRIITDADAVCDGLLLGFSQLFTGVLTILGTIVFMFRVSFRIAPIVVALTPLSMLTARFITKRTYRFFGAQADDRARVTDFVQDRINGEKLIHAFGAGNETVAEFDELNKKLTESSLLATFYSSLPNPSSRAVNNLIYMSVGVIGALYAIAGGITVGGLTAFLGYAREYAKPFNDITGVLSEMQNAFACAGRLFELMDMEVEKIDQPKETEVYESAGDIQIEKADFSYKKNIPFMKNLTLHVSPGQRVAIVGPTGSGKTTFVNLLMRFYDTDSGSIKKDGIDITEIPLHSLRSSFGMVLQETFLFSGTIAENLSMGDESISEREMEDAARKTHAYDFIRRLPNGFDTYITSDGGSLSQGQKQLLCITRVMLRLSESINVLILDEATSSIDTRTEMKIQRAFKAMMENRTTFIVAHRLQTIRDSDVICFMDHGSVIEQGTHEELMARGEAYAGLYNSGIQGI